MCFNLLAGFLLNILLILNPDKIPEYINPVLIKPIRSEFQSNLKIPKIWHKNLGFFARIPFPYDSPLKNSIMAQNQRNDDRSQDQSRSDKNKDQQTRTKEQGGSGSDQGRSGSGQKQNTSTDQGKSGKNSEKKERKSNFNERSGIL